MKIYLYIKVHNKTNLKYFGKTTAKDPFKYRGSGKYWNRHLVKHGDDVTTTILGCFQNFEECKRIAIDFSIKNNIVESKDWANLKLETLDGGWDHINSLPKEIRKKLANDWYNNLSEDKRNEINKKKAHHGEKNYWYGKHRCGEDGPRFGIHDDYETYAKISEANKNKIVVKHHETDEIIGFIDKNHENIQNGIWVSVNRGKKRTAEENQKRSQRCKESKQKGPSSEGTIWWTNGIICKRSVDCPGENFYKGRIIMKVKIS